VRSEQLAAAAAVLGDLARPEVPIGPLTTYRVGGPAALFVEVDRQESLEAVSRAVEVSGLPVLVVGKGSNLLVADAGFPGIALRLGGVFSELNIENTEVTGGGGLSYPVLARRTAAAGLTGMEWAVGIPGSVGGAVRMNAGGHGAETKDTLVSARVLRLGGGAPAQDLSVGELQLSYRHSAVDSSDVVTAARFHLSRGDAEAANARIAQIVRWRRENQPGGQNAGSVFTNPPGDSAGRLVEAAGLKGFRIGSAEVSTKHANFIQADPGGSADDVWRVVQAVRAKVEETAGVSLAVEVRHIGGSEPAEPGS
jgi:UDP-N-acetylmuramate dehydrogenase